MMANDFGKLAELLGVISGDGCLSRSGKKYLLYICGHKSDDLWFYENVVVKLISEVLSKEVKINFKKGENTLFVRFSDKKIFNYLHSIGVPVGLKYSSLRVPQFVRVNRLGSYFIRGLFATDGCVFISKQHRKIPYYPRLEISSKSRIFLLEISNILNGLGLKGSLSIKGKASYRLELPGFSNLQRW